MSAAGEPYLSLVVTARNDDHGGNLMGRMQAFAGGWIEQARRFGIPSELIIVEWNPPADRPPLAQALRWPADMGPCQVRIIEVSRERHARFAHAEALPLYQMIAKNIGIRRARGQFILATNIDILFSSELAQYIAERRLKTGRMYRMDRHDAMSDIPAAGIEAQLEYCRTHLIRINMREGSFNVTPEGRPTLSANDVAPAGSGLLFGRGWMPVERYIANEPFRWVGERAELLLEAPAGVGGLRLEIEPGPGTGGAPLDLEVVGEGNRALARVTVTGRSRLRLPLAAPIPSKLWFRVHGGGVPAPRDPRVLNFRLFHLAWERQAGAQATVESIGGRGILVAAWNALQHVINKMAHGGPLVDLTVPVSPRLRRILNAYLDWNGVIGMVRHAIPYWKRRRRFRKLAPVGADVFAPDAGLSPGAGWKLLEEYRGEGFRRAANGAELVVSPAAPRADLGLQLEVDSADVALLDAAGQVLARQRVEGVAFVSFALPRVDGRTQVFRLGFTDASGAPVEAKVFWCGWTRGAAARAGGERLAQPWGAGWRWDPHTGAMVAEGAGELVVRTFTRRRPLFLEVDSPEPVTYELRDGSGAVLATFTSRGRETHRLELPLALNRTHLLTLSASGPYRAHHCDWNESGSSTTAVTPAFLHTNGCGDFTLLARDHWFDLRGYPEFDLFSMNIDSVFCFTAHHGGAREEMLPEPMRIYHIEHGTGSGWTPEGQAKLFERIAAKGLSFVDNEDVLIWAAQMNKLASPMIFNHDDWGMRDEDLPETRIR